jgi:hypothetical protein
MVLCEMHLSTMMLISFIFDYYLTGTFARWETSSCKKVFLKTSGHEDSKISKEIAEEQPVVHPNLPYAVDMS